MKKGILTLVGLVAVGSIFYAVNKNSSVTTFNKRTSWHIKKGDKYRITIQLKEAPSKAEAEEMLRRLEIVTDQLDPSYQFKGGKVNDKTFYWQLVVDQNEVIKPYEGLENFGFDVNKIERLEFHII